MSYSSVVVPSSIACLETSPASTIYASSADCCVYCESFCGNSKDDAKQLVHFFTQNHEVHPALLQLSMVNNFDFDLMSHNTPY